MRSPTVESLPPDDEGEYSDLTVLQSNAGYYIGTIFTGRDGFQEPGSRDSGYYRTREEAQAALDSATFSRRAHP